MPIQVSFDKQYGMDLWLYDPSDPPNRSTHLGEAVIDNHKGFGLEIWTPEFAMVFHRIGKRPEWMKNLFEHLKAHGWKVD